MPGKESKTAADLPISAQLRNRAEDLLRTGPPDLSTMPARDIQALVHELQVHQMELQIQNEELRRAQMELAESHDRYSDLYEFAPVGYLSLDADGRIEEANLAAASLFGVDRTDLPGAIMESFVTGESRDPSFLHRRHVFANEEKQTCELEIHRNDGTDLTVRLESIAVNHEGKRRCRTALIDITDLRKTEEGLKDVNALFQREQDFNERLVETASSLILVLDLKGRVVRFNPAFERLTGWDLKKSIGRDWFETFPSEPEKEAFQKRFKSALRGKRVRGAAGPVIDREGMKRLIEWFDAPLTDASGETVGLLWIGNDVTERIQFEEAIHQVSEEEKKRIADDLHDSLGSQLTGIGYQASSLKRKLSDGLEVSPEDAETIIEQVRKSIVLVRTLSLGLQPVKDGPNALTEALKNLAEWVETSSMLNAEFQSEAGEAALANLTVANHLYRIAQEAATNAIRHSNAGHLTIRLEQDAEQIILCVTDDGSGFDRADLEIGSGIGLQTMEYRTRAIGGKLSIGRSQGGGTEVKCAVAAG